MNQITLNKVIKLVDNYNKWLNAKIERYGTDELYLDKSSTFIGLPEVAEPIAMKMLGSKCKTSVNGIEDVVTDEFDIDNLRDTIKWCKRCVSNGCKFIESENPDAFLEAPDEDD